MKQTIQKAPQGQYVIDGQRERHINPGADAKLVDAIRAAGRGEL